ncbi:MAG: serine hydrolase, partial [Clostridia bacterium]|nr:serine hydrolase [Clostridia bacterium]
MKQKKYRLLVMTLAGVLVLSGQLTGCSQQAPSERKTAESSKQTTQTEPVKATSKEKIYSVGSISKVYVTTAVMQLSEEGKVELDAPVTEYIPDFTMADERYKKIT